MTTGIFLEALTPRSGKTLVSLGLADSLIRRADQVGYFRPVHLGDELRATAQVEHRGSSLLVSSGVIYHRATAEAPEQVAAQGLGTFNRYPATKRQLLPEL